MKKKMVIYKTTNLINGKIYVGQDSKNDPNYYGSGIYIKRAIKKYGKENFKKETIECCTSIEQLNEREIYWIKNLSSQVPIGYNLAVGGLGHGFGTKCTEEAKANMSKAMKLQGYIDKYGEELGLLKYNNRKKKQSESHKKRYLDINERAKYSKPGKLNGMYGKKHSKDSRLKISKSRIGKKSSIETKIKLSLSKKGCKNSNYKCGYKQSGCKNGHAKKWKLISIDNIIYYIYGELMKKCDELNVSGELLLRFKNSVVPQMKLRNCNEIKYKQRINTLGWALFENN